MALLVQLTEEKVFVETGPVWGTRKQEKVLAQIQK